MPDTFFKRPEAADLGEGVPMWGSDPPEDPHALARAREAQKPPEEKVEKVLAAFEETAPEELWGDDEEEAEEAPAAEGPAAKAAAPAAPDMASLQAKIDTLEQRLRDTQSWGNHNNMQRLGQQQLAETLLQMEQTRSQLAAAQKQLEPPKIDDVLGMEMDDFLSDPKKASQGLAKVSQAFAEWSRKQALAEVAPYLSRLQALDAYAQSTHGLNERSAYMLAREQAARAGVATAEQFDALADRAYEAIGAKIDPREIASARLSPDVIVSAIQYVANQQGLPVKQPAQKAPSAGAGSPGAKAAGAKGGKRSSMKRVEKLLGVDFGKEDVASFNERWAQ